MNDPSSDHGVGQAIDFMAGARGVARWVQRKYPSERLLFATTATLLETGGNKPTLWSAKRYFLQHNGGLVITERRLAFRSIHFAAAPLLMLSLVPVSIYFALSWSPVFWVAPAVFLFGWLKYRPYYRDVELEGIRSTELHKSVRGMLSRYPFYVVYLADRMLNVCATRPLPAEAAKLLRMCEPQAGVG